MRKVIALLFALTSAPTWATAALATFTTEMPRLQIGETSFFSPMGAPHFEDQIDSARSPDSISYIELYDALSKTTSDAK